MKQITWAYYLDEGTSRTVRTMRCFAQHSPSRPAVPQIWNPLPWFATVNQDNETANVQTLDNYFVAAKAR